MTATAERAPVTMAGVVTPVDVERLALRTLAVTKRFGEVMAVEAVDLDVRHGEFLAVLGPSGCGKTTLLRLVAGFELPDAGGIEIDGRAVAGPRRNVAPERRRIGMVFQESALFPHLDVAGNIGFGLARANRGARVAELVGLVGLAGLQRRMPHELSGGQQQRVALARALAPDPALILLDEPFSSLDATLRAQLRVEVRDILRRAGATALFVTHDQSEALEISDRVAVMRNGRIEQLSTPDELYLRPVNRFVAGFVGEANLLPGEVRHGEVQTLVGRFRAGNGALVDGTHAEVLLRPEQLHMLPVERLASAPRPETVLTVVRRIFHGSEVHHVLRSDAGLELEAATASSATVEIGTRVIAHARAHEVPVYPLSGDAGSLMPPTKRS
ncbi:MAG TPA: ABC transporter ATP-binding protein [Candidatus Limnocylindrales bacterium]|nr:ABC transporter ATP-binding protein [Candidatus Limnocylindrales bacterium]